MNKVLASFFVAAMLVSCGTSQKTVSLDSLNGEWNVVKIDGEGVTAPEDQTAPFLGFDTKENRVYGSTSCNRLTGSLNADIKTGSIDFGALGSTRMMCREMDTERKVLDALGKAKTFKVQKNTITLSDGSGKAVMELNKKK